MVKKVTLDTLEIEEPDISLPERTVPAAEEQGNKSARRPAKWRWIFVLAVVLLVAAGGVSYWLTGTKTTTPRLPNQDGFTAAPLPAGPPSIQVNDFIIPFQDDTGKYQVILCDLTFEMSAGRDAVLQENMVEVRKIIYELLKKTRVALLRTPSRDGLKEDISKSVSVLLGQDAIKAVYFTKFVVL